MLPFRGPVPSDDTRPAAQRADRSAEGDREARLHAGFFLGQYSDLLIGAPAAPVSVQVALPFCTAGALVKTIVALRGPSGEPPFVLLALGPGRERTVHEEAQDAAHAALDTLAGLIATGQLGPDREAVAMRLSHLAVVAAHSASRRERP